MEPQKSERTFFYIRGRIDEESETDRATRRLGKPKNKEEKEFGENIIRNRANNESYRPRN